MTDSSHSIKVLGARPGVSVTQLRRRANVHDFTPFPESSGIHDRWQVEIVDLTATYMRNAGMKSAAILDGAEFCRVEEFPARHYVAWGLRRRSSKASHSACCSVCILVGDSRSLRLSSPNCWYYGSSWRRSGGTQRVDMDTAAVRLRNFRLLTPSGQGPH